MLYNISPLICSHVQTTYPNFLLYHYISTCIMMIIKIFMCVHVHVRIHVQVYTCTLVLQNCVHVHVCTCTCAYILYMYITHVYMVYTNYIYTIIHVYMYMYFSGPLHRERRRYLRTALNELYLLLSDQPGLLGPKVSYEL